MLMAGDRVTRWECAACGFVYDEAKQGTPWDQLPDDWECPVCGVDKSEFEPSDSEAD
jgi:rubredoxin